MCARVSKSVRPAISGLAIPESFWSHSGLVWNHSGIILEHQLNTTGVSEMPNFLIQ